MCLAGATGIKKYLHDMIDVSYGFVSPNSVIRVEPNKSFPNDSHSQYVIWDGRDERQVLSCVCPTSCWAQKGSQVAGSRYTN